MLITVIHIPTWEEVSYRKWMLWASDYLIYVDETWFKYG